MFWILVKLDLMSIKLDTGIFSSKIDNSAIVGTLSDDSHRPSSKTLENPQPNKSTMSTQQIFGILIENETIFVLFNENVTRTK